MLATRYPYLALLPMTLIFLVIAVDGPSGLEISQSGVDLPREEIIEDAAMAVVDIEKPAETMVVKVAISEHAINSAGSRKTRLLRSAAGAQTFAQDVLEILAASWQDDGNVKLTITNELDSPICHVFYALPWKPEESVDLIDGEEMLPGMSRTFELPARIYTLLVRNCAQNMVYYNKYLDIAAASDLPITKLDAKIAPCQTHDFYGAFYLDSSRYLEAKDSFDQALKCYQEVPLRKGEGGTLNNIGLYYLKLGRYAEADTSFRDALAIARETGNRHGESAALNGLATTDQRLGRYVDALSGFQEAVEIQSALEVPFDEAIIRNNLAVLYAVRNNEDEALKHYQKNLELHQDMDNRKLVANTLNNIGHSYRRLEKYQLALEAFEQALTVLREPKVGSSTIEVGILNGMGLVFAKQERYEDALEAFEKALAIYREQQDPVGESRHLYLVARVLDDLGRYDEAMNSYLSALDVLESVREISGSDHERTQLIDQFANMYEHALDLHFRLGLDQDAFYIGERGRARAFLDMLGGIPEISEDGPASGLLDQKKSQQQRIIDLEEMLEAESAKPYDERDSFKMDRLEANLEDARGEFERIFRRLKSSDPDYISLASVEPLAISLLQDEVLDEHTTLVEYYLLEEYALAWVIDKEDFNLVRLDISRDGLREKVKNLLRSLNAQGFDAQIAQDLYDGLITPLKPHIRHSNLVIIPHNDLHYLPFAALLEAQTDHYLVEEYAITYAPSASALQFIYDKRNENELRMLAMGNPDGSLPHAQTEAEAVAAYFDGTLLLAQEARESQVYNQAGYVDILHLAAHGFYDSDNPLFSRIELAPDEFQDGNLELHEVYGIDLTESNLVVLSACNTSSGKVSEGDELIGLTRAFLFAGAPAIVTTHWAIDDRASGFLMESFYSQLQDGRTNAQALQQAQLDVLAQDQWREPYYWAAYNLTGDYRGQGDPELPLKVVNSSGQDDLGPASEEHEISSQDDPEPPPEEPDISSQDEPESPPEESDTTTNVPCIGVIVLSGFLVILSTNWQRANRHSTRKHD